MEIMCHFDLCVFFLFVFHILYSTEDFLLPAFPQKASRTNQLNKTATQNRPSPICQKALLHYVIKLGLTGKAAHSANMRTPRNCVLTFHPRTRFRTPYISGTSASAYSTQVTMAVWSTVVSSPQPLAHYHRTGIVLDQY